MLKSCALHSLICPFPTPLSYPLHSFHSRICEEHIKAPSFLKDGELLRFCQRCGVSHPLAEFDGQRKSCRKQLEKHNARRWAMWYLPGSATAPFWSSQAAM